jgi:hypothetical protein
MNHVVFVAPAAPGSFFKRVVRALGDDVTASFHSMLLSTSALPDPEWSLRGEAEAFRLAIEPLDAAPRPAHSPSDWQPT